MIGARISTVFISRGLRSVIFNIVKVAISATILLSLYIKFSSQLPSITSLDIFSIAFASSILVVQPVLIGARWQKILSVYDQRRSILVLIRITWISVFANQFLPAGVGGDAIRMYYLRRANVPVEIAVISVIVDRILALVALALLIIFFIAFLDGFIQMRLAISCGAILFTSIAFAYLLARRLERPLPTRLESSPMVIKLLAVLRFTLAMLNDRLNSSLALACSMAVHILSALAFLVIARAIGIGGSALTITAIALILALVQMVPVSIGGWGLREMVSVALLSGYGVDGGHAALASILLGLAYLIASLPGAILWLFGIKGFENAKVSAG